MTPEDIYADITQVIREETAKGENYFRGAIQKSGLVLSGDLLSSVRSSVEAETTSLSAEINVVFKEYWRFNDMKQLTYARLPNYDAMLAFVKKVGVEKFPWVNGYTNKATPTVPHAAERIARTLMWHRKKTPVVVHPNHRRKYNKTKADFRNVVRRKIMNILTSQTTLLLRTTMTD